MGLLTTLFMPVGLGGLGVGKNPFSGGSSGGGMNFPDAPVFQPDPNVAWSQDRLKGQSDYLINGLTQDGGNLSGLLGDTVSFNPLTTQYALQSLQAQLAPSYRNSQQNLTNTLEANNQLTGSTTASAFGNLESDYMAQLTAAGAQAALNDVNRALSNRVSLYGTGLNTVSTVGTNALTNQSQINNFALANYENQVAQALGNQAPQTGGLSGALTGAAGGALAGLATGNPYIAAGGAVLGGVSGYSGQPGTGGSFLNAGAGLFGSTRPQGLTVSTIGANQGGESINNTLQNFGGYGLSGYGNYLADNWGRF